MWNDIERNEVAFIIEDFCLLQQEFAKNNNQTGEK